MTQAEKKLDIFPHIFPEAYFERMKRIAEGNPGLAAALKRWMHIPVLWNLDQRIRMMKRWPGYQQVLTLSMPAIEFLGGENETPELARLANDGMHEIVQKHPELFPCFVASLPMNNVAASLEEIDRAIGTLGAKGHPDLHQRQRAAARRARVLPDLRAHGEEIRPAGLGASLAHGEVRRLPHRAEVEIRDLLAVRLALRDERVHGAHGVLADVREAAQPKIITHHLGAMAPFFVERIGYGMDQFGTRTADEDYAGLLKRMKKRPLDFFRMFYGDTSVNGSASAIRCGLDFFGVDHVLFGTDCPFDPEGGPLFIRETIKTLDRMTLKPATGARSTSATP